MEQRRLDLLEEIIKTAVTIGWHSFELSDVAKEKNIKLDELYCYFPNKHSVIDCLIDKVNRDTLSNLSVDDLNNEEPSDVLIEVIMLRFDAMAPYKDFIRDVQDSLLCDPTVAVKEAPKVYDTIKWMIGVAGFNISGPFETLRVVGFAVLYARLLRVWLELDDSSDGANDKLIKSVDEMVENCKSLSII